MPIEVLVTLLHRRELFLARGDLLGDPWEGSTTAVTRRERDEESREIAASDPNTQRAIDQVAEVNKAMRQWTFVSCWHMNEHESAAMWRLYGQAIAIRSTFRRLRQEMETASERVYLGQVKYIDYTTEAIRQWDLLAQYIHKRRSFQHERELRIVLQDQTGMAVARRQSRPQTEAGRAIAIDPTRLIEKIYVAPETPTWRRQAIEEIVNRFGLPETIVHSALDEPAIY